MLTTLFMEAVLAIGLQATGATPVAGNEPLPVDVRTALGTITKDKHNQCTQIGGTLGADVKRLMSKVDLNDDGHPDYIIDESAYTCRGTTQLPCKDCVVHVLLSFPEGYSSSSGFMQAWKWRVVQRNGAPAIEIALTHRCNAGGNDCDYIYWSWKDDVLLSAGYADMVGDYSLACTNPRAARLEVRRDGLTMQEGGNRKIYRNVLTGSSFFGQMEPPQGYVILLTAGTLDAQLMTFMFKDRQGVYAVLDDAVLFGETTVRENAKWRRCSSQ